jgi:hypothetical protein
MKYDLSNDIRKRIGKVPARLQIVALSAILVTLVTLVWFQFFLSYDTTYALQGYTENQNSKGPGITLVYVPAGLLKECKIGKQVQVSMMPAGDRPEKKDEKYTIVLVDQEKGQLFVSPEDKDKNNQPGTAKKELVNIQLTISTLIRKKIFG